MTTEVTWALGILYLPEKVSFLVERIARVTEEVVREE